jgi:hypothetical protein
MRRRHYQRELQLAFRETKQTSRSTKGRAGPAKRIQQENQKAAKAATTPGWA